MPPQPIKSYPLYLRHGNICQGHGYWATNTKQHYSTLNPFSIAICDHLPGYCFDNDKYPTATQVTQYPDIYCAFLRMCICMH